MWVRPMCLMGTLLLRLSMGTKHGVMAYSDDGGWNDHYNRMDDSTIDFDSTQSRYEPTAEQLFDASGASDAGGVASASVGSCACTRASGCSGNCPSSPSYADCGGSGLVCGVRVYSAAMGRSGTVVRHNDVCGTNSNVLVCFDGYSGHDGNGYGCDDDDGLCSRVMSARCASRSSWWVTCSTLTVTSTASPTVAPAPTSSPTATCEPQAPVSWAEHSRVLGEIEVLKQKLLETTVLSRDCERRLQRMPGFVPTSTPSSPTMPSVEADATSY